MFTWIRRAVFGAVTVIAALLATGVTLERAARARIARDVAPPGRMIEFDGRLSHLNCTGEGAIIVILEAGHDTQASRSWIDIQPRIAEMTRVCSYDRAGLLWSEPRDEPRDAYRITEELHDLLDAAGEMPPYVMVGHSLGGVLVRVFGSRYPGEVAGYVLLDASHPEQLNRRSPELSRALSEPAAREPSRLSTKIRYQTGVLRRRIGGAGSGWRAYLPRSLTYGFAGEREALSTILAQGATAGSLSDLPLIVLTAGKRPRPPGLDERLASELDSMWLALQNELAGLSSNSIHRIVADAGHYIHRDAPAAVIEAVSSVLEAVADGGRLKESDSG